MIAPAHGGFIAAGGMLLLTQIGVSTSFFTHVMPAEVILGLGLGFTFVPLSNLALLGVEERDSGAASAVLNATQQVGSSLGTALLNTIYATAVTSYIAGHLPPTPAVQLEGLVHGYRVGFAWGGVILVVAASCGRLMAASPDRPAESEGGVGWRWPGKADQEPAQLGDGERHQHAQRGHDNGPRSQRSGHRWWRG